MQQPALVYTLEDQQRMAAAKNYFAWQSRLVTRELGRRVVEIGCGIGNFTAALLDRELVVAVDRQPECVERLVARYGGRANLHTAVCDAGDPEFCRLAAHRPDSCVCLNVLEHIADDAGALAAMGSILLPGGMIALIVPAFPALYGPIDRNLGHYRRYRPSDLRRLAGHAGLAIRKMRYMNTAGFFGWWWNARVSKRETQSPGQIGLFDRCIVPVLSAVEEAVRPPFGQSLFAVLVKPSA